MNSTTTPPIYNLGSDFYDEVSPAPFPQSTLRYRNQKEAQKIGLEDLTDAEWKEHFWSFQPLPGNIQKPLALRYHGHQFQHYNPDLGDGRGFLFAQIQKPEMLFDLGTKGSGTTPYSRGGDGRLTLKGAFREILATELLESLGVTTSKTFSVFETGESLQRHDEPSPTRSAVLVRLSHSHIRFGTFQRLAYLKQTENIKKLIDYCIEYYYPHLSPHHDLDRAAAFLRAVAEAHATTTAQWMSAGFVHGVLNTDNMNITGESFDYGPYRFLNHYDIQFTAAYFDHQGLYCFGRQPYSVYWNLCQLGLAIKSAFPDLPVEELLEDFGDQFQHSFQQRILCRLNLKAKTSDEKTGVDLVKNLILELFTFLENEKAPFEQTLFDLHSGGSLEKWTSSPQKELYLKDSFKNLKQVLESFAPDSHERKGHPYFQNPRPCTLIIEEIEELWKPIATEDDWTSFSHKLTAIRSFRGVF